ncbi:Dipeptidyl peptidase 9 isoform 2 [Schistosoma japonicum]|uniref:Dipeptidyl peptidase 9 isoform 2 n=2 Tax=Schistosoma japonicum TaxID=6182 RepID=A0A4Z2D0K1_SCHJA|nr:Dipeptidyl peptidase 9 isoform 2 [Schistosoma japonicum]TNN09898.1 Dipeptidyl peptidase 9 isoform 2 [Schistosoma japonicum]
MSESDSSNESMYMFERFHQVAASYGFALHTFSIPTLINIRKISNFENKLCCRVYFISYPPSNFQPGSKPTLFCTDIILQNSSDDDQLIWYPLLPNEFVDDKNSLALADFLIHERMRISVSGITNYCLSDCGKLIICASSQIYSAKDSTCFGEQPNYLEPIKASLTNVIQPIMCPLNSDIVVCLSNENIFIGYVPTNTWISITNYTSNSGLSAGIPPFVVQEEFDRYIGYWWRPTLTNDGFYQLLYEEVDERNVAVTRLFHGESGGGWENQRYPSAGTENASSTLKICQFKLDSIGQISDVQTFALRLPLKQYIPNFEYLVRVGWTPDGNFVWCQLITRLQQRLSLILIPVDNFLPISNVVDLNSSSSSISNCLPSFATSPCIELVSEVESKFWIKVHDFLTFLKQPWYSKEMDNSLNSSSLLPTDHDCCTFIWASHRTGFTHLYLIQCSWPKTNLKTMCHNETILHEKNTGVLINAKQEFVYQLTSGDWEVTGNQIWLDEENKFVYFEAFKEHPLLRHIYSVSYDDQCKQNQLNCLTMNLSMHTNNNDTFVKKPNQTMQNSSLSMMNSIVQSSLDPLFHDSYLSSKSYPLSYELNTFNAQYGIMIIESSSLNKLVGIQICQVIIKNNERNANRQPVLQHIGWIRKHISHYDAFNGFLPTNPPLVLRFDILSNLDKMVEFYDNANKDNVSVTSSISNYIEFSDPQSILYGQLFLPNSDHSRLLPSGYPTLHFVYGGPGIQLVRGSYSRSVFAHAQLFCHFGYAVFLCDCRGSANRGINFDGYIKNRLGQVELDDHVAFLKYAAKSTGFIDLSRIAIMGYSFGGYMSLMAAMRCHDVYKAAIAISPVVDWLLYDTAYTERYIGLPEDNPEAYTKGNVMEYVSNMPSNKDHLIIFHGGQDENVHFLHTSSLIEKLDASGKPHQFQFYPNSRHRLKHQSHLEATVLSFLEDTLSSSLI